MAFTNYISQSILLGLIYYGHGLGLRDQLAFHEAMLIVPAVWMVQMLVSVWWLGRFRFGPLEWLWRSGWLGHRRLRFPGRLRLASRLDKQDAEDRNVENDDKTEYRYYFHDELPDNPT
jgi:hypothetical protein